MGCLSKGIRGRTYCRIWVVIKYWGKEPKEARVCCRLSAVRKQEQFCDWVSHYVISIGENLDQEQSYDS